MAVNFKSNRGILQAISIALTLVLLICIISALFAPWYRYTYVKVLPIVGNITTIGDEYLTKVTITTHSEGQIITISKSWYGSRETHLSTMYKYIFMTLISALIVTLMVATITTFPA